MKNISKILLTLAITLLGLQAQAQLSPTLYFMKDLPLNNHLNPAFQPQNGSIYVGIPVLSSIAIDAALQGEGFTAGNFYFDADYEAIIKGNSNYAAGVFNAEVNAINFGFMVKDMYFTFDSKVKIYSEGRLPKDLEHLFWYGNGADETLGRELGIDGLNAQAYAYAELALGFSKEILKDQLTAGGKVKILSGLANVQATLDEGSYIYTDPNSYNIRAGFNPNMYVAGVPLNVPDGKFLIDSLDTDSYKFKPENWGVAFDLGGSWDLPWVKGLNVSASVLDIGFISWKGTEIKTVNPNEVYNFNGFNLDGSSEFAEDLLDSLKSQAEMYSTSGSKRKWLYPTIYFGANYEVAKYFNVGALFGYQFARYENLPMFAISANTQKLPVNISASYSYYNKNNNIGVGLVFGKRAFQWHIITDNLLAISYKKAQNVNVRFGFNLLLGKSKADRSSNNE